MILVILIFLILLLSSYLLFQDKYLNFAQKLKVKSFPKLELKHLINSKLIIIYSLSFLLIIRLSSVIVSNPLHKKIFIVMLILGFIFRYFCKEQNSNKLKVHSEINQLCISIQDYLSQNSCLEVAIRESFQHNNASIISNDINLFLATTQSSIINDIANFFKSLAKKYKIQQLIKSSSILDLEIQYSSEQGTVFEEFNKYFLQKQNSLKKLSNSYKLVQLSLDFMLLLYLFIIFFFIPNLLKNNSWINSIQKDFDLGISFILFWFIYLLAIFLLFKKESELI